MKILLTSDMIDLLNHHRTRTGVSTNKLLHGKRGEIPKGVDSISLQYWMVGQRKSVSEEGYKYVIALYESLPDNPWVEIDEALREQLCVAKKELHGKLGLLMCQYPPPGGLKRGTVATILNGKTKKARQSYIEYLLSLPNITM